MHYEGGYGLKPEFIDSVRNFIEHTMLPDIFKSNGLFRCPCSACMCLKFFEPDKVMVHLYCTRFKPRYFVWINHGESDGLDGMFYSSMPVDVYDMIAPHSKIRVEQVRVEHIGFMK